MRSAKGRTVSSPPERTPQPGHARSRSVGGRVRELGTRPQRGRNSVEISVPTSQPAQHQQTGDSFVDELLRTMTLKDYSPGSVLFAFGETASCMFFVGRGVAERHRPAFVTHAQEGQYFGEEGLFSERALRSETVTAHNQVVCLVLRRAALIKTLQKYPSKMKEYEKLVRAAENGADVTVDWIPLVASVAVGYSPTIQVAVRFKPQQGYDNGSEMRALRQAGRKKLVLDHPIDETKSRLDYKTDVVFDETATNETVFNTIGRELLGSCLQGYNTCVFAYGQSGSGKTHTIRELAVDVVEGLFSWIREDKSGYSWKVEMSYVELYMEKVNDLLQEDRTVANDLHLRQEGQSVYIDSLTKVRGHDAATLAALVAVGSERRQHVPCATHPAWHSGHAILIFYVTRSRPGHNELTTRITMADLAGPGRDEVESSPVRPPSPTPKTYDDPYQAAASRGQVALRNERLLKRQDEKREADARERAAVSCSLNNLLIVIQHLASRSPYVPYRNSKLTQLLSDCLGGSCRTWMIATVLPFEYRDTHRTLQIASAVNEIATKPVRVHPRSRPFANMTISPIGTTEAPPQPPPDTTFVPITGAEAKSSSLRLAELLDLVARANRLCSEIDNGIVLSVHPPLGATASQHDDVAVHERAAKFPGVAFPPPPGAYDVASLEVRVTDRHSTKTATWGQGKLKAAMVEAERWVAQNYVEAPPKTPPRSSTPDSEMSKSPSSRPSTPSSSRASPAPSDRVSARAAPLRNLQPLPDVDVTASPFHLPMPDVLVGSAFVPLASVRPGGAPSMASHPLLSPVAAAEGGVAPPSPGSLVLKLRMPREGGALDVDVVAVKGLLGPARCHLYVTAEFPRGSTVPSRVVSLRSDGLPRKDVQVNHQARVKVPGGGRLSGEVYCEVWARAPEDSAYPERLSRQLEELKRRRLEESAKKADCPKCSDAAAEVAAVAEELTRTRRAMEVAARDAATLRGERDDLQEEVAHMGTLLETATQGEGVESHLQRQAKVTELESQVAEYRADVERAQEANRVKDAEIAALKKQLEEQAGQPTKEDVEARHAEEVRALKAELAQAKEAERTVAEAGNQERTLLYALLRKIQVTRSALEQAAPPERVAAARRSEVDALLQQYAKNASAGL